MKGDDFKMSRKGGYTILDFSGITLTEDDGVYVGTLPVKTYDAIKNSGKPVYVSGLKIESIIYGDSLCTNTIRDVSRVVTTYFVPSGALYIEVTNAGAVTVTVND